MSDTPHADNSCDWLVLLYVASEDTGRSSLEPSLDKLFNDMVFRLNGKDLLYDPRVQVVLFYDRHLDYGNNASIQIREHSQLRDITEDARKESPDLNAVITVTDGQFETNSGDWHTLSAFITWAMSKYPQSTHTLLAVIGHGAGLLTESESSEDRTLSTESNIIRSDKSGGATGGSPSLIGLCPDYQNSERPTYMLTKELGQAIESAPRAIDVLFLDACFMGMVEIVYEVRQKTKYVIAGQNILYAGLPYEQYITALTAGSGAIVEPEAIARKIVEIYNERYHKTAWTITAIKSQHIEAAANLINSIAGTLYDTIKNTDDKFITEHKIEGLNIRTRIHTAYSMAQKFDSGVDGRIEPFAESYVDLFDFFYALGEQLGLAIKDAGSHGQYKMVKDNLVKVNEQIGVLLGIIGEFPRRTTEVYNGQDGPIRYTPRKRLPSDASQKPDKLILDTHIQNTHIQNKNHHRYVLSSAYGLSIYLPLGRPPQDLVYYQASTFLQFAGSVPKWGELLVLLLGLPINLSPEPPTDPRFDNVPPKDFYIMRQGEV